jgi:hypothetical protein
MEEGAITGRRYSPRWKPPILSKLTGSTCKLMCTFSTFHARGPRARYRKIHPHLYRQPGIILNGICHEQPVRNCLRQRRLQAQDPLAYYNWFNNEFWRFVFAQQEVGNYVQTFLEYPPMQEGASFNMYAERIQQVRE